MSGAAARLTHAELDKALSGGEFSLVFQPKIRLSDGGVAGAEAFARWQHPDRGIVAPREFLEFVDTQGRATELTKFVLRAAVEVGSAWGEAGRDWRIALNLAPDDLADGLLPATMEAALNLADLEPECVVLELPSPIFSDTSPAGVFVSLDGLKRLGVGFAVDGAPVDQMVLERVALPEGTEHKFGRRAFLGRGGAGAGRRFVRFDAGEPPLPVETACRRTKAMGFRPVLTGVESGREVDLAKADGFWAAQGPYFCQPLDFTQLEHWTGLWSGPVTQSALLPLGADALGPSGRLSAPRVPMAELRDRLRSAGLLDGEGNFLEPVDTRVPEGERDDTSTDGSPGKSQSGKHR